MVPRLVAAITVMAALISCVDKGDPAGKQVLDWKATQTTSLTDVTLGRESGARVVKDQEVVLSTKDLAGDIELSLHVERGVVEAVTTPSAQAVMPPTLHVPLAVSAKLVSTGDWIVSGSCEPPSFGMPSVDAQKRLVYDRVLFHTCTVRFHYKSPMKDLTELLVLEIRGDGGMRPTFLGGTVVVR